MLPTAHVRLAHPDSNGGARILRRGYSFTDGTDGLGRLDAGLFFLAYQRDVRDGFVPLQRNLARNDALNEYIQHVGSAVFAVPPGVRNADDWWGRANRVEVADTVEDAMKEGRGPTCSATT